MSRLTKVVSIHNNKPEFYEANIDLYPKMMGYEHQQAEMDCINKLGKLEDLEEELGCPLEVVVDALKQGYIYVYDNHYNCDDYTTTKAKITFNNDKFYIGFARNTRRLEDYQKTWWLKGEKDE